LVKLKGFQKLTSTDKALKAWFAALQIQAPKAVLVPLQDASGRVLAENLVAPNDLPRFNKSAMDGYAVKSADLVGASQFKPVTLQLTQSNEVKAKQAKQVWTGNSIPSGADAVVMLENTQTIGDNLQVTSQLALGDNISKQGEDIKAGTPAITKGLRLNPYHLGLAAAMGFAELKVFEKPKIAIIATGNELAEVGSKPADNQIYDSNKTMISAECHELGAETIDLGIVKDNAAEIAQKIRQALQVSDLVITTGGTSVGGLDLVPDVADSLGKPGVIVHGVALRPAMPTAVAAIEKKPVLILSGNPVAAVIGFEVFGRPLVCKLLGLSSEEQRPMLTALLARKVSGALGRKTYVRVKVKLSGNQLMAYPISAKGSGTITTMTESNGFVIIPPNREGLTEGETVTVHMFAKLEIE
jgi:molybdopterin molybdotransferase